VQNRSLVVAEGFTSGGLAQRGVTLKKEGQ